MSRPQYAVTNETPTSRVVWTYDECYDPTSWEDMVDEDASDKDKMQAIQATEQERRAIETGELVVLSAEVQGREMERDPWQELDSLHGIVVENKESACEEFADPKTGNLDYSRTGLVPVYRRELAALLAWCLDLGDDPQQIPEVAKALKALSGKGKPLDRLSVAQCQAIAAGEQA